MENNKSYYVTKNRKTRETVYLEYEKMDGYKVTPKVKEKDAIEVSKIVFVSPDLSEKLIRKKIDKKIEKLLKELKTIDEDDDSGEDAIRKSLMDAEKLRVQIISNYVKYLGNTYAGLTLEKIKLIINSLRYKLYTVTRNKLAREEYQEYSEQKEGKRGR